MDIYTILKTKISNLHMLNRYCNFIQQCSQANKNTDGVFELHHICPKSIFPEYKHIKLHTWNCAKLTIRQHYIAHWMLANMLGHKMKVALFLMTNTKRYVDNVKTTSRQYEKLKLELREFSFIMIYNKETKITKRLYYRSGDIVPEIPRGWERGYGAEYARDFKYYYNSNTNEFSRIFNNSQIPHGWVQGNPSVKFADRHNTYYNADADIFATFLSSSVPENWVRTNPVKIVKCYNPETGHQMHITYNNTDDVPELPYGYIRGSIVNNKNQGTVLYHNQTTNETKRFRLDGNIPVGWVKGYPPSRVGTTEGKVACYDPITKVQKFLYEKEIPENYVRGSISSYERTPMTCPHCNKHGKGPNMLRYHFDNCKNKH